MITAKQLADRLELNYRGPADLVVTGVAVHSKQCQPGQIYIARRGEKLDGHDFIAEALSYGAVGAWVENFLPDIDCPQWLVPNPKLFLWRWAKWRREQFNIPLIVVTGSCGKTSTVHLLAYLLKQQGKKVFQPQSSFNNDWGLPITMINQPEETEIGVYEIGSNYPGEIDKLAGLLKPEFSLITMIGKAHLEGFHDTSGVLQEKMGVVRQLIPGGKAVVPYGLGHIAQAFRPDITVLEHGVGSSYCGEIISVHLNQTDMILHTPTGDQAICIPQAGLHLAPLLAGIAALGSQLKTVLPFDQLLDWRGVPGRMQFFPCHQQLWVHDAYNANPNSMTSALHWLAKQSGYRIAILGGMRELGKVSHEQHQMICDLASSLDIDQVLTFGAEFSHCIIQKESIRHIEQWQDLVNFCRDELPAESMVLIKASRFYALEQLLPKMAAA